MTLKREWAKHTKGRTKNLVEIVYWWDFRVVLKTFPSRACTFWLSRWSLLPLHFLRMASLGSLTLVYQMSRARWHQLWLL